MLLSTLIVNAQSVKMFVPKNYTFLESKEDFNRDGIADTLLHLSSLDGGSEKIIILKGERNNKYSVLVESDKVLMYPNTNGQGHMIQDISIGFFKSNIVVSTAEIQGININREFYFKYKDNNFYFYKYIESYGTYCNTYTIGKIKINKNIQFILSLKDFSIDLFFRKYYNSIGFQRNLKRETLDRFENNYSNSLKAYQKKNNQILKKIIKKMLVYTESETICTPNKYLDMYLYLTQKNTISKSNDIAFFFDQVGYHKEAIYLLEKILKKYPTRTVAHYNLADAYWALGEKKKAIVSYTTYIEQMCNAGKEKRIPKVVRDRVSSK
jgi:hypothetical protein